MPWAFMAVHLISLLLGCASLMFITVAVFNGDVDIDASEVDDEGAMHVVVTVSHFEYDEYI
jgi:hypothetical protein